MSTATAYAVTVVAWIAAGTVLAICWSPWAFPAGVLCALGSSLTAERK